MKPGGDNGPHVFVDDLEHPELRDEDRHHLTRSLRLRPGDTFTASDGAGSWRLCRLGSGPQGEAEPNGEVVYVEAPRPKLTIGFALIKGGRPELVVQKLTELGVDAIVPFTAEHSVVRWDADRGARHVERLRRVAREAAMQSRQVRIPEIGEVAEFADLAADPGTVRADITGNPPSLDTPPSSSAPKAAGPTPSAANSAPSASAPQSSAPKPPPSVPPPSSPPSATRLFPLVRSAR